MFDCQNVKFKSLMKNSLTLIFVKKVGFLLAFLVLYSVQNPASATHVMGGDLEVECISPEDSIFRLNMSIYSDCRGISLSTSQSLQLNAKQGGCPGQTVNFDYQGKRDVTPLCGDACSACEGVSGCINIGMDVYDFTAVVDLSDLMAQGCCEFTIEGIDDCCRNNAIVNASTNRYYMSHTFNPCNAADGCPSSPEFATEPIAVACEGESFIFNQGAQAGPEDSLGFELVDPLENNGQPVSWMGGYSKDEPIEYLAKGQFPRSAPMPYGFHFDEHTGDIQFTPAALGAYIFSVQVNHYRDGELISEMRRDLQIEVIDCPNNEPPVADFEFWHEVCAGQAVSADIDIADPDSLPPAPDSVWIDWNEGIPDGDFSPDSGQVYATGNFSWTPEQHHAGPNPHSFVFSAKDNACPVPGTNNQTVRVKVNPKPMAIINYDIMPCGEVKFLANLTNYPAASFSWIGEGGLSSNQSSFTHYYQEPGKYPFSLTMVSNECVNTYHDTLLVPEFISVDAGDDRFICKGDPLTVNTEVEYEEGEVSYIWNTNETSSSISHNFKEDTTLVITVSDESICTGSDTVHVTVFDEPDPGLGSHRVCHGSNFSANTGYDDELYDHEWKRPGDEEVISTSSELSLPGVTLSDSGKYVVFISDTTEASCLGVDTLELKVNPRVKAEASPSEICVGETSHLSAQGGDNFVWMDITGRDTLALSSEVSVSPQTTTQYLIRAYSTTKNVFCDDIDTVEVIVNDLPEVTAPLLPGQNNQGPLCMDHGVYFLPNGTPAGGVWSGPDVLGQGQFAGDDPGLYDLTYSYTDPQTGCLNSDESAIEVTALPIVEFNEDAIDEHFPLCTADDQINLSQFIGENTEGNAYWTGEGVINHNILDHENADLNPGFQYELTLHTENQYGCSNSKSFTYRYTETPDVVVSDHEICYDGSNVNLDNLANHRGERAVWSGPGVDVEARTFDPGQAGVNEAGHELTLTYTEVTGACSNEDRGEVVVHPLPEIEEVSIEEETSLVCETDQIYGLTAAPSGGSWSGPGVIEGPYRFSPNEAGPGQHILTYEYQNATTGCLNTATVEVEVEGQPEVSFVGREDVLCSDDPYSLETEYNVHANPDDFTWRLLEGHGLLFGSGESAQYRPVRRDGLSGGFLVEVESGPGQVCPSQADQIHVPVHPNPEARFSIEEPNGCEPHETAFFDESTLPESTETSILNWTWDFGDGEKSTNQHPVKTFEDAGTYTVSLVVESDVGCKDDFEKDVEVYPRPKADFTADPVVTSVINPLIQFENQSSSSAEQLSYTWNFGDHNVQGGGISREENPAYSYVDTGRYTISLKVENEYGCTDQKILDEFVTIETDIQVFIPTIFSPESAIQKENEQFRPVVLGALTYETRIFNRWGEEVFYSDEPDKGWDGTVDGAMVQEGAYTYVVKATDFEGQDYKFSGTLHLMR